MYQAILTAFGVLFLGVLVHCGGDAGGSGGPGPVDPSLRKAHVFFIEPVDGAETVEILSVKMGAEHFEIEPASLGVREGAGHFHVWVDAPCVPAGYFMGTRDYGYDFDEGQTEARIYLPPGNHQLCLQAGTAAHIALPIADVITIEVIASTDH